MRRFHLHINTNALDESIAYYSALFGAPPTRREADYAKWLLDEPAVNVALSARGREPGVDHVGVSYESDDALRSAAARLNASGIANAPEEDAACCYAKSDKVWTRDPSGAVWELFHTVGDLPAYGSTEAQPAAPQARCGCC